MKYTRPFTQKKPHPYVLCYNICLIYGEKKVALFIISIVINNLKIINNTTYDIIDII